MIIKPSGMKIAEGSEPFDHKELFTDNFELIDASLTVNAKKINTIINVTDVPNLIFEGSLLDNLSTDGTDQITKYQRLARYLKSVGGGVLKFPTGTFSFSQFPLYDMVSIEGNGQKKTYIKALSSAFTNFTYLVLMKILLILSGLKMNQQAHPQ
jgi:hypothetical protein